VGGRGYGGRCVDSVQQPATFTAVKVCRRPGCQRRSAPLLLGVLSQPRAEAAALPLRKDAEVNRGRLLAAAREVFAESGLDVTMHDVAAQAGVGVGTAYRRFANKDEIIDSLSGEHVGQVAAIAASALEDPDAWNGLTTFLERLLQLQQEDRGLMEILNNPRQSPRSQVRSS
jgi:AcrR family transcriptional regulator